MKISKNGLNIHNNRFYSILIVYDDDLFINKLNKSLSKKYKIFIANNGYDAVEKLKKIQKPDLIISSLEMPVMDGHVFLEELSKLDNYYMIPFIFIVPNSSDNIIINSREEGVIDYIKKPFNNTELEIKIEALIHKEYDK